MKFSADNIKEFGTTEAIKCPKCGNTVYMNLLKATNGLGIFNVSLLTVNVDVFAICPSCSAMFAVDNKISNKLSAAQNNYTMINEKNITFIRDLK